MSLYEEIMEGLKEAIAYERGEITLRTVTLSTDDTEAKKDASEDKPLLTKR